MAWSGFARAALPGSHDEAVGPLRAGAGVAGKPAAEAGAFISTAPAECAERRRAFAVAGVSAAVFLAAVPFATIPLPAVPAFIPIYQSALVVGDLITAFLLFAQYAMLRIPALLFLGAAYFFAALMASIHALTFPGLFAPSGLLGANAQTTAWLYMFWHGGFPLLVCAYVAAKSRVPGRADPHAGLAIAGVLLAAVAAAIGATVLATQAGVLPPIMQGSRYTPTMLGVVSAVWGLSLAALIVLWRSRPHTVLDLWVGVALCAWLFDIGLAAVFNAGRFDLGFYAGRIYGLVAASVVLGGLLVQHSRLYGRLGRAHRRARQRLRMLHAIDNAVLAGESPEAIAAAVAQSVRELLAVPRVVLNKFDLAAGEVEWIGAAGRRRTHVGPGVRYPLIFMGDVEALRRNELQIVRTRTLPDAPETRALLASGIERYMVVPMIAGGELIGALSFGGDSEHFPQEQVEIARELAAQLAIALRQARLLEQVRSHAHDLEARVRERTAMLDATNRELEAFTYSVSHDLRAPLRAVDGYARMLEEDHAGRLDEEGRRLLGVVRDSGRRMGQLIDDLLNFARLGRQVPAKQMLDMTALAREVAAEIGGPVEVAPLPRSEADRALLRQVWVNLIGNAVKYSAKRADARVQVDGREEAGENVYWVRDNGAGFDMRYSAKLFGVFQRLHSDEEFSGTGVGLAIVERVITRHGGRVWAEGRPGEGACFYFSLPA